MRKVFMALQTEQDASGQFLNKIVKKTIENISEGSVVIKVEYSSLNYKDALSAKGNKGVTRNFPHTPGIDAAGIVEFSNSSQWKSGDKVIVTGFDLGMNTDGGFGEYIVVPEKWVISLPDGITTKEAMIYGTAGFTAGLSVNALLTAGITPQSGTVAVSGSTGGVGSIAVAILSKLGFKVAAISSKDDTAEFLKGLGASEIISRQEFDDQSGKPLLKPIFSGAIDTVGGNILGTIIKSLGYDGVVTTCGMVAGGELNTTVFPFILKGIKLIGIDSVEYPREKRDAIWKNLAHEWKPGQLENLAEEITLERLPEFIDKIYQGQMKGRALVKI